MKQFLKDQNKNMDYIGGDKMNCRIRYIILFSCLILSILSLYFISEFNNNDSISLTNIFDKRTTEEYKLSLDINNPEALGSCSINPYYGVHLISKGEVIILEAIPEIGWSFICWSGDYDSTENPLSITMIRDISIVANFERSEYYLNTNTEGEGHIDVFQKSKIYYYLNSTIIGEGKIITNPEKSYYSYGETVTVEALPDDGWSFTKWSGDIKNSDSKVTFTIEKDVLITATFSKKCYLIEVETIGLGDIKIDPKKTCYSYEETVTVEALPDDGWSFTGWSGYIDSDLNFVSIKVNNNVRIIATFEEIWIPTCKIYGFNFGPYTKPGQNPNKGSVIEEQQIRELLEKIKPYTEWVRTYGCDKGLEIAGKIAHELELKIAMGCWLGRNLSENERQIENLIRAGQAGEVDIAVVGNEVLLRRDLNKTQLINYINRVRENLPDIPIAYSDVYYILMRYPEVINACDIVMPIYHPFFLGVNVDLALYHVIIQHQDLLSIIDNKKIWIGEVGFPTAGQVINEAVPTCENAGLFFKQFVSWAKNNDIAYFYFEAYSEPWKIQEGSFGPHWGVFDSEGNLKPCMKEVFDCITISYDVGNELIDGPGDPSIMFTFVPEYGSHENLKGRVFHVRPVDYRIVLYIKVGNGWWVKPMFAHPRTMIYPDGGFIVDYTTGGKDYEATEIVAYLIPNDYNPPLLGGVEEIPDELNDNCVAMCSVTREP
jgi:exo-beta-1,3-glucanase (GH17 family)